MLFFDYWFAWHSRINWCWADFMVNSKKQARAFAQGLLHSVGNGWVVLAFG
jgi:hypothetical protein